MFNFTLDFTEIFKLHDMLTKANIPHTMLPTDAWISKGWQIRAFYDANMTEDLDDCVIHKYSHGAEAGLMETYHLGKCDGWESAEEIFDGWEKLFKNRG